jgi:hypothetical protein
LPWTVTVPAALLKSAISQAVLAALWAIADDEGRPPARALAELLSGHGFERACEALSAWAAAASARQHR